MDIEGTTTRQLHYCKIQNIYEMLALEKPELYMRTDDIYGTKPNVMKDTIKTTRVTNPNNPDYQLSKIEECPATPPRFLRDHMKIDVFF